MAGRKLPAGLALPVEVPVLRLVWTDFTQPWARVSAWGCWISASDPALAYGVGARFRGLKFLAGSARFQAHSLWQSHSPRRHGA